MITRTMENVYPLVDGALVIRREFAEGVKRKRTCSIIGSTRAAIDTRLGLLHLSRDNEGYEIGADKALDLLKSEREDGGYRIY